MPKQIRTYLRTNGHRITETVRYFGRAPKLAENVTLNIPIPGYIFSGTEQVNFVIVDRDPPLYLEHFDGAAIESVHYKVEEGSKQDGDDDDDDDDHMRRFRSAMGDDLG